MHTPSLSLTSCLLTGLLTLSGVALADSHQPLIIPAAERCQIQPDQPELETALSQCQQLAESGSARAAFLLGKLHYQGQALPRNIDKAYRWFAIAAEGGQADAQFYLGRMLVQGEGVAADPALAFVMLQIAAINGHNRALDESDRIEQQLSELEHAQALALLSRLFLSYQGQLLGHDNNAPQPEQPSAPAIPLGSAQPLR